jgi:hypothetical protein
MKTGIGTIRQKVIINASLDEVYEVFIDAKYVLILIVAGLLQCCA